MNMPPSDDRKVDLVGFDGIVHVECGRSVPIACVREKDLYYRLPIDGATVDPQQTARSMALFSRADIESGLEERRLTLFPQSLRAFTGAMAIYVTPSLLEAADYELPETFQGEKLPWQWLGPDNAWATCASESTVEDLLDDWGRSLMFKTIIVLHKFFITRKRHLCEEAERVVNMAWCAARNPHLLADIHLLHGVALINSANPRRVDNLYEDVVRPGYPDWDWETFRILLQRMIDTIILRGDPATRSTTAEIAESMLHEAEENVKFNKEERVIRCYRAARKYEDRFESVDEEIAYQLAEEITSQPEVDLTDENIRMLACEPVAFFRPVFRKPAKELILNSSLFCSVAREFAAINQPGMIATSVLEILAREFPKVAGKVAGTGRHW